MPFFSSVKNLFTSTTPHRERRHQRQRHHRARVRTPHEEMSAFLKIDRCSACRRELPWEWVPPVTLAGRTLAGTGVWRSGLVDDRCAGCAEERGSAIAKV